VHDNPQPTEGEHEQGPERRDEEEEMRGPMPNDADTPGREDAPDDR
jgi:hypothetical protein